MRTPSLARTTHAACFKGAFRSAATRLQIERVNIGGTKMAVEWLLQRLAGMRCPLMVLGQRSTQLFFFFLQPRCCGAFIQ